MKNSADLPKLAAPSSQGVIVRNAIKSYGVGSRRSTVLDGLDMNVKKGTM
jgi:hypothetical protein